MGRLPAIGSPRTNIVPAPQSPARYLTPYLHTPDAGTIGSDTPEAITLGRIITREEGISYKMKYGGDRHLLVFGPNGSGKGTRLLVPNLLQLGNRSICVVDPKGELAAITAPYRRELGRVVILNPFGVLANRYGYGDLRSAGFNPLASLDPSSSEFNVQAGLLAEALITVNQKDPHWDESARQLLAALIMHTVVVARRNNRVPTLGRVRYLLCLPSDGPHAGNDFEGEGLPRLARVMSKSPIDGLRNKASQFQIWNKEIQGIVSSAKRQTEFLDDPEIANDLGQNGFDFAELKRQPVTVYLILPPEKMQRHAKWLRLVLTSAFNAAMRPREPHEPRLLFMLDEFAALGHLEIISTVWALVRGYGIQIMPILQDLSQLKALYNDKWETFLAQAGAVSCFAPNDATTAEMIARRGGDLTRLVTTFSSSVSHSHSDGKSSTNQTSGFSSGPQKVPFLIPHKLYGLPRGCLVHWLEGQSDVTAGYAPGYYDIQQCAARARVNPYFQG